MTNQDSNTDDSGESNNSASPEAQSVNSDASACTPPAALNAKRSGEVATGELPNSSPGTAEFIQSVVSYDEPTLAETASTAARSQGSNEELIRILALEPPKRAGSLGRVEDYEILNIVGRGGMGIVARAFDESLHRNVAIKVMSDRLISSDRARKRFFREARAAASISHPNVVTIHAVKERNGVPYLVMEFVEGDTLHERIRSSTPFSFEGVVRIGAQIAEGLSAAHRRGIIHRDVKPGNVMLENGIERVKLTDFGLARLVVENTDLTSMDSMVGTPAYMSPEQVDGLELTPASDLFSLGCVLYAMFAGRSPFQGSTSLACAQRVKELQPDPVSKFAQGIPIEFQKLLNKLLSKDPRERPQDAHCVAEVLLDWSATTNQSNPQLLRKFTRCRRKAFPKRRLLAGAAICLVVAAVYWYPSAVPMPSLLPNFGPSPLADNVLLVDSNGGEFKTLAAALEAAQPDVTIVLAEGYHQGPFTIADATRLRGVTIDGKAGAILIGSSDEPVLQVADVPNVTLKNLSIQSKPSQLGVNFKGNCPASQVEQVDFSLRVPAPATIELLRFDFGASGTESEPIVVQNCKFEGGGVAVVVGSHDISQPPVSHIHFHDNFVSAASKSYGIPIVIQGQLRHVLVERNTLYRGLGGLSLRFDVPKLADDLVFRFNTMCDVTNAFFLNDSHIGQGVTIHNNLIVHAENISTINGSALRFGKWFNKNQWLCKSSPTNQVIHSMFELLPESELKSTDPQSPDFLVPIAQASGRLFGKTAHEIEQ